MNFRGPTSNRPRYRAWALIALLTLGALAINPPLKFKVRPRSRNATSFVPLTARHRPQVAGSPVPAVFRYSTAPPASPGDPHTDVIDPQPASVVFASLPTIASDPDAIDPITRLAREESNHTSASLAGALLAPARLDSDVVRSAFNPEPTAEEANSSPAPDLAVQGPTFAPAAVGVLADQGVDFAGPISSPALDVGPLFAVPGFDKGERRSTPPQAVDTIFTVPAFDENQGLTTPAQGASQDVTATAPAPPQSIPVPAPELCRNPRLRQANSPNLLLPPRQSPLQPRSKH